VTCDWLNSCFPCPVNLNKVLHFLNYCYICYITFQTSFMAYLTRGIFLHRHKLLFDCIMPNFPCFFHKLIWTVGKLFYCYNETLIYNFCNQNMVSPDISCLKTDLFVYNNPQLGHIVVLCKNKDILLNNSQDEVHYVML
jgi:hypothetical protein